MKSFYISFITLLLILKTIEGVPQNVNTLGQTDGYIPTGVPFLLIAPDARSNGIGCVGAATSPDANSLHWNPAKLAFINPDFGISLSYLPWLRQLVNDINYLNISTFVKFDSIQKIGCSFKYLSLGNVDYITYNGNSLGSANPVEYSIDLSYSRKLSLKTFGAISIRHIYSEDLNLSVNYPVDVTFKAFAFDLSLFHFIPISIFKTPSQISYGIALSNIGPLIKNVSDSVKFLPSNLKIGTSLKLAFNENHSVEISFDANKLLAPEHPENSKNWSDGFFGSFADASGGFEEEMQEINIGTGIEYWFRNEIALRTGYFYESPLKGNRQFFTLGSGIKYKSFCFDFAYLFPSEQRNPLENTVTFSLSYYFSKTKQKEIKRFSS